MSNVVRTTEPADVSRPTLGVAIALLLVGALLGGLFGGLVAAAGVLIWRRAGAATGALGVALLVLTALASVLQSWPGADSLKQSYASDREIAAAAGLAAGVATIVALTERVRKERVPRSVLPDAAADSARAPAPRRNRGAMVAQAGPYVAIVLIPVLLSAVWGPDPLSTQQQQLADGLRFGQGLVTAGEEAAVVTSPVPIVVATVAGSATGAVLALLAGGSVALVMRLATLLADRRTALATGLLAGLLPSVWGLPLPESLAGGAVLAALLLAWPPRLGPGRAVAAGLLVAGAGLARPEAWLVAPVLGAWVMLRNRRGAVSGPLLLAAAVLGLVPWLVEVHGATESWWIADGLRPTATPSGGVVGAAYGLVVLVLAFAELWSRRRVARRQWVRLLPLFAIPALSVVLAIVTLGDHDLRSPAAPIIAIAAGALVARSVTHRITTTAR